VPDLENYGTEVPAAPTDRTKLFGVVALLVHQVYLIEYFLRLFQAEAVFSLNVSALLQIELTPYRPV
jgi:hypothetical protein